MQIVLPQTEDLLSLWRYPLYGSPSAEGRGRHIYDKGVYCALCLTNRNFATFWYSQEHGNSGCPTGCVMCMSFCRHMDICTDRLALHSYQAWASVLLVQLYRAMRRPLFVGRVTARTPTLFCICKPTMLFNSFVWELADT